MLAKFKTSLTHGMYQACVHQVTLKLSLIYSLYSAL